MGLPRNEIMQRQNAHDRGYDRRWKKTRAQFLRHHLWCWGCLAIGIRKRAEVVDHIIPHHGDMRLFWAQHNWQPVCQWHHNSIKPELERRFNARKITAADLNLQSSCAAQLTRDRHRPDVGADGFAIGSS